MDIRGNSFYINRKKGFSKIGQFDRRALELVIDFAYDMSFGRIGAHRTHRSGGNLRRKNGEIFANAFQGKLAELAIYDFLKDNFEINEPDLDCYGLGAWDDSDFTINGVKVSIKSTKSFGNLLLLEEKDWDSEGNYIPNLSKNSSKYEHTILVRLKPSCEDLFKNKRWLYSNDVQKSDITTLILSYDWAFDIVGFVTLEDVVYAIRNNHFIPQGAMLNGSTEMDASNYYIQAGDFRDIEQLGQYI